MDRENVIFHTYPLWSGHTSIETTRSPLNIHFFVMYPETFKLRSRYVVQPTMNNFRIDIAITFRHLPSTIYRAILEINDTVFCVI